MPRTFCQLSACPYAFWLVSHSMTVGLMLGSPRCPRRDAEGTLTFEHWMAFFFIVVTQETIIFFTSTYLKPVLQSAYLQHSVNVTKIECGCSVCYYVITMILRQPAWPFRGHG